MARFFLFSTGVLILLLSGCASLPSGPSVMVMPGTGVSFEQFRNDDAICQQYALGQVGGTTANQAATNSGLKSAAVGSALGAAAGAAIAAGAGAAMGPAAAFGAGSGLLAGGLLGTGAASNSMYATQQSFDTAYIQCMYAKGNQVPVSGQFSGLIAPQATQQPSLPLPPPPPPAASNIPPPPPGAPPPPPPTGSAAAPSLAPPPPSDTEEPPPGYEPPTLPSGTTGSPPPSI